MQRLHNHDIKALILDFGGVLVTMPTTRPALGGWLAVRRGARRS
jgi:hypothetical protein